MNEIFGITCTRRGARGYEDEDDEEKKEKEKSFN